MVTAEMIDVVRCCNVRSLTVGGGISSQSSAVGGNEEDRQPGEERKA